MASTSTPTCETEEIKEENVDTNVKYDGILNPEVIILSVKDEEGYVSDEEPGCKEEPDGKEEPDCKEETDCKEEPFFKENPDCICKETLFFKEDPDCTCKEEPDCKDERDYKEEPDECYKGESDVKDDLSSNEENNDVQDLSNASLWGQRTREEEMLLRPESCNFPESCDCIKCEPVLDSDGEIMDVENKEPPVTNTQKPAKFSKSGKPKKKKYYYPNSKVYKCDNCDYKCNQLAHMEYHRSIHTGEKPLACKYCEYRARHPTTLTRHVRSHHTGEKPYSCDFCDYKATQPGALHRHRRTHTGEKPYACKFCGHRSPDLKTIQIHELSHTGGAMRKLLNPVKCYLCDFSAARRRGLVRHLIRKHPGEPPLPYRRYHKPLGTSNFIQNPGHFEPRKRQVRLKDVEGEGFPSSESRASDSESDTESDGAVNVDSDSNVDVDDWELPNASSSGRCIKAPKRLDL